MIPTWEIVKPIAILVFLIMTIWFAFKWRSQTARTQRVLLFRAFVFFPFLAIFILAITFFLFVNLVLEPLAFSYHPVAKYQFQDLPTTLYIYENTCFPPDSRTECNYYSTEIRHRVWILPITTTLLSCPCFFEKPILRGDIATFPIEASRDKSKVAVSIDMRYGKVVKVADW